MKVGSGTSFTDWFFSVNVFGLFKKESVKKMKNVFFKSHFKISVVAAASIHGYQSLICEVRPEPWKLISTKPGAEQVILPLILKRPPSH